MNTIVFSEDQKDHINKVLTIGQNHPVILDTTIGGGGKTLFALFYAYVMGITRIIVFCPGSLHVAHWNKHKNRYGCPIINIITYDTLRGSKPIIDENSRELLNHGYLIKLPNDEYEVSDLFKWYVEEGNFMIIIDESDSVKNDSGKTKATKTCTKYLTIRNMSYPPPKNRSYVYFCSMTPFDEPEHLINFAYLTGVIKNDSLYDKDKFKATGAEELYQYCRYFYPKESDMIWGTCDIKLRNVNEIAYKLMTDVYLKMISSFAKDCQKNFLSKQTIYYAFFDFEPEDEEIGLKLMNVALNMIKAPVKNNNEISSSANKFLTDAMNHQNIQNSDLLQIDNTNNDKYDMELGKKFYEITNGYQPPLRNRSGVMHGMATSQSIKTYYAGIKFIKHIFNTVRNVKVIVFVNFKESLNMIMNNLAYLNPVSITGESNCTEDIRNAIVSKFNEHNLELRLLLIISQIGSHGIELDDVYGDIPRVSIGFPDFFNTRYSQCPARTLRRFTRSNSLFFFIFMNDDKCNEESVKKSIRNKSKIMEDTVRQNGIIPPVYFERINNPHTLDINLLLQNAGMKNQNTKIIGQEITVVPQIKRSSVSKTF